MPDLVAQSRQEREQAIADAVEEQTRAFFDRLEKAEVRVGDLTACIAFMCAAHDLTELKPLATTYGVDVHLPERENDR